MFNILPPSVLPPLPVISTASLESVGAITSINLNSYSSVVWTSGSRAFFIPFHLEIPIVVTKLLFANGAAVSGNLDMAIYNASFVRLVSIGSTAQAGANSVQALDITDTLLGAGDYYLAAVLDNTTGTVLQNNVGIGVSQRSGVLMQAAAFPLPALANPITVSTGSVPLIGLRQGGTVT